MARGFARPCVALLALWCGACQFVRPQPGVQISSSPAGAELWVDGEFSGFVTPARVALRTDEWHRLELRLAGHVGATRLVGPGGRVTAVDWTTGTIAYSAVWFPLFLPLEDLVPFSYEARSTPQRIHVELRRRARGPS
jgi:hypothetical protein